jgi:oxygen-dependent protoporphyrinogen oxidase
MSSATDPKHIVVIGAGITGLTAAYRLLKNASAADYLGPPITVTIVESSATVGGKIRTSPFGGISAIDEGPDAYLARVPQAVALARELQLGDDITHPTAGHAAVMHKKLHPIPEGLMLGVPTGVMSLARSDLMTWRGKIRAGLEPILPSSGDHKDSIGNLIRQRFGKQVQQLLVDPLVGSIYATDTNNFSLAMVPQLAALATGRSVLLTARKQMKNTPKSTAPIFETPRGGLGTLTQALNDAIVARDGHILTSTTVHSISRANKGYVVDIAGETSSSIHADCVIVASPARASASLLKPISEDVAVLMSSAEHSSVVMATIKTVETDLPKLAGLSGYLVAKPDQDRVTAASFGSNKWSHWKPSDGSMILRVSLGRDGAPTHDLIHEWNDERIVRQVIDEVSRHTQTSITPDSFRVTRWPDAFPQYRPGHMDYVEAVESSLLRQAPGIFVAGASWRGIGIPACVAQAEKTALCATEFLSHLQD